MTSRLERGQGFCDASTKASTTTHDNVVSGSNNCQYEKVFYCFFGVALPPFVCNDYFHLDFVCAGVQTQDLGLRFTIYRSATILKSLMEHITVTENLVEDL